MILKNKWIRIIAILGMVYWIFSSNSQTKKIVDYVKEGDNVKQDVSYTISKVREALIVSKMSPDEVEAYYLKKQKDKENERLAKEAENEMEATDYNKTSTKTQQNLSGIAKLQEVMKARKKEELEKEKVQNNTEPLINYNANQPTEKEKLFVEKYVAEKYGTLTEIRERTIKCGDYVSFDFMIYENGKQVMDSRMKMNLLIGSDVLPKMEEEITGMFYGQKKKFNVTKNQNNKNASQEIKILNIKEVEKKELLNCN